jgi:hypothetical protein
VAVVAGRRGRFADEAEGVFKDCRGLTAELIVAKIETALERVYVRGQVDARPETRKAALIEAQRALAGARSMVERDLGNAIGVIERELAELDK